MRVRGRQRGYTVVEVMSAMTLFALGAAGVISMQRVTLQGGDDARRLDVATNLANAWSARLQRDATFWTLPSSTDQSVNNIANTAWLKDAPASTGMSAWITPADPRGSNAFDLWGRDRAASNDHIFCAQYRLGWLTSPGAVAPFRVTALLRTEVRVFWARLDSSIIGTCNGFDPDATANKPHMHFVYVTSAVRPATAP